jgi:hypothetical protein
MKLGTTWIKEKEWIQMCNLMETKDINEVCKAFGRNVTATRKRLQIEGFVKVELYKKGE